MSKDSSNSSQDSLEILKTELTNLANRIGGSTDRIVGVGNTLITRLGKQYNAQSRHQRAIIALTVVIALATICYTFVTWLSVKAMREANEIHRQPIQPSTVSNRIQSLNMWCMGFVVNKEGHC